MGTSLFTLYHTLLSLSSLQLHIVIELCLSVTPKEHSRLYIPHKYNGIPQPIQLQ